MQAVYPSQDALPANTLRLYLHFSRPMRARDAIRHVHLLDAGALSGHRDDPGREVALPFVEVEPGLWDPDQRRLTLLFHPGRVKRGIAPGERLGAPLVPGRQYRLVVDAGAMDAVGRPLGQAYERPFRVEAADRTSPQVAGIGLEPPASADAPLVLRFPEPLDHALLSRLMWVEGAQGDRVEGQVEVDEGETRWTFRPERPWVPGPYAVRIHPALEDRAGNRFDRLFDREPGPAQGDGEPAPYRLPFTMGSSRPLGSRPPAGP